MIAKEKRESKNKFIKDKLISFLSNEIKMKILNEKMDVNKKQNK